MIAFLCSFSYGNTASVDMLLWNNTSFNPIHPIGNSLTLYTL